ncbi:MAG TPA: hypothetical protein VHI13_00015, partial [Candidatus Kapabacteria bacterium]|nr:hypothetical protein [Candidatus Kapabacteria bacterium]
MKKLLVQLLGVASALAIATSAATAQTPRQISYQGLITTSTGQPVTPGTYTVTFRIYDRPTGGYMLWTETQPSIAINRGLFNVMLGSVNPLDLPFDRQYWITTQVGSNTEMMPRTQLASAPYSFRAINSDSADAVAANAVGTENIRSGAVTPGKIDATGSIAGQVLTSTGSGVAWSDAGASTAGVTSINGKSGALSLKSAGGIILTQSGNEFLFTGPTGVSSVNSADHAIAVTNGTGPAVTLTLVPNSIYDYYLMPGGISGDKLRDSTITGRKIAPGTILTANIADNSINSQKIIDGSVQNIDLANPWIAINPGTGLSGGGTVQLGNSITLDNTGVLSVAGTANRINVSAATGAVTISTPQDIAPASSPTFANLVLTGTEAVSGSISVGGKVTSASTTVADPGNTLVTKDYLSTPGSVSVNTNNSLTGNGTSGSPLGVNLANANAWSATQALPATTAQGDNLIASVNAGTGAVNAARIANGLTDAQVNDNLTISGGTVDGTPIGATTPSTGAFTTINGTSVALAGKATSASTVAADPGNTLVTKDFVAALISTPGNSAVSTNASLTGDGTSGSPLGVNLANANAWSATQTLPATAAQGDNLIASVNAGAGAVNAARIANGLTDAQVNDNLTISGGTVDGTPIGATTPSTGAFTNLTAASVNVSTLSLSGKATSASTVAADPGNTLVTKDFVAALISTPGNSAVSTNASLTGDGTSGSPLGVNLANANEWSATQTLPATAAQGDNLIASVNAGAGAVNAARIGNGLTDAQVNDNLTISGGTVDGTPIGATTPGTGAFTNLTAASVNVTTLSLTGKATSASTVAADPGNTLVTKDFVATLISTPGNSAVSTNASLTGDGTSGSPLGVNLANTNEWSATQTLPATAAQGDNLIASVNAGAGAVNAARIGNGLTDAQVNDNLTISGGTVDGTPIGATTPSTGAFTNLTAASVNVSTLSLSGKATSASTVAADPGNTLVTKDFVAALISTPGNSAVSTNASLTGDGTSGSPLGVNLANANEWSATQTLPATAAQGDNLIASVNAGAGAVNAARIGNGLTDAQVNDNLTISGGTVDGTPIGATTPSTGAFTTINGTSVALTGKATSA